MAIVISNLYPTAAQARSLAGIKGGGDQAVENAIDVAINTAITAGLFTCTADMTGYSSQNIQNNMNLLQALGYTVSLSSVTLTINW